jgi:predicted ArsR family transcriptional regulator
VGLAEDVDALGALAEPQRLRVYEHLAGLGQPSSLTEISEALAMGRTLAAFHLGKLVEAGFVEALAPVPGGRGRPSQRYRVSRHEVSASVPARHYELVAEVLLLAAEEQGAAEPLTRTASRVARRHGAAVAATHRPARVPRTARARTAMVSSLLDDLGYAPRVDAGQLLLRNCPFDRLRQTNCQLVCSINHALAEGYLDGLGVTASLTATLRPSEASCCVVVSSTLG